MKHILFLLITFTLLSFANELQIEHSFGTALQKAKDQNKSVMMLYSAVWCPECGYMKDVVLKDAEVVSYIEPRYIVLYLDIDKDKLPEKFNYIGIPTFFFIDSNGNEKNRIVGGDKAGKFLAQLKALK